MKRIVRDGLIPLRIAIAVLLVFVFASGSVLAQVPGVRGRAAAHAVVNFAALAAQQAAHPAPPVPLREKRYLPVPGNAPVPPEARKDKGIFTAPMSAAPMAGPALLSDEASLSLPTAEAIAAPPTVANFEALGDNDTVVPPGTMGAVGPDHLVVTLNSEIRIQDRVGAVLSTVSLESFWSSTGAAGVFNPNVVYDQLEGRWLMSAASDTASAASSVLIAASQTGDPTGSWNIYRFDADAADLTYADYPALGFNKDWAVITVNMYKMADNKFSNGMIFLFQKGNLYVGNPSPAMTTFADPYTATGAPQPAVTFSISLSTLYLVRHWNSNSGGTGFLRISTITGNLGSEVYKPDGPFVAVNKTWEYTPLIVDPFYVDFAPQADTTSKIQTDDARVLNVVYRNGSLWVAHNAFLPAGGPTRVCAQWWKFAASDGTLQQFGRVDDPTGAVFYAYPSIAVNSRGDAMLGFSRFSTATFPSAAYAARAMGDGEGSMRTPVILKAGEQSYVKLSPGGSNRWGDYSATVVDPANDLDFWTLQEYSSSPDFVNGHDRWGTWWGKITPPVDKRTGQTVSD